jgi:protein tyrosine/serine phosphatase
MQTITLLEPADNATTEPLQLHDLTLGGSFEDELIDRSHPRLVEFTWQTLAEENLRYTLVLAQDAAFASAQRIEKLHHPRAWVTNLLIGTRYFWKVQAHRRGRQVAESAVRSFCTHPQPPRWLLAPGITNLRDIGGWQLPGGGRIRQGMIFRSSEMNSHLHITRAGRHVLEDELKLRTDVDLRGSEEVREPALNERRVEYINIPILSYHFIREPFAQGDYRALFNLLAQPMRYPVLIHCWGGADRTGTVVFLLQALLGLERAALICDYECTSLSIFGQRHHASIDFQDFLKALAEFAPEGASLQQQAEAFLLAIGVTPAEIDHIRSLLIEKIPA